MKRSGIWIVLALVGIAIATGGGYWWGLKQAGSPSAKMPASSSVPAERKVLYYRNPMGLPDTSPEPKKDSMGMDYTPVYADEVPADSATANSGKADRKVLYYRNPMGLPDTSPVPKQDSMGMDYTPVYADEQSSSGQVKISPDKVQKLGVKTEQTALRDLTRTVRAVGQFQLDQASALSPGPSPCEGNAVELAAEVGRNKPALAGVSGNPADRKPETVAERPYSGLQPILNSTA